MKIAVAGAGYVGLSIATLLAQNNHVELVDVVPEKVDKVNKRISPIQDDAIERIADLAHAQKTGARGLRAIMEPEHRVSKTIFMVLPDDQVDTARRVVNQVTGGLDVPDSGIMFALPVTMVEGLVKKK